MSKAMRQQKRWILFLLMITLGYAALAQRGKEQLLYREHPVRVQLVTLPFTPDSIAVFLCVDFNGNALEGQTPDGNAVPVSFVWEFRDTARFIVRSIPIHDTVQIRSPQGIRQHIRRFYHTRLEKQPYFVAVRFRRPPAEVLYDTIRSAVTPWGEIFAPVALRFRQNHLEPVFLHRAVPYASDFGVLLLPVIRTAAVDGIPWRLERAGEEQEPEVWQWVPWQPLQGRAKFFPGIVTLREASDTVFVELPPLSGTPLRQVPGAPATIGWLRLPIAPNALFPGHYRLSLWQPDGSGIIAQYRFAVRWIHHPVSLHQLRTAQRMVRILLNDEQEDWLTGGSFDEQLRKFHAFWQYLDPTPKTAYNEALVAFYRRVDYALFNLGSQWKMQRRLDDRQRAYVCFGPPASIQREFDPDGTVREVWDYRPYIGKIFVFERFQRQYRLVDIR